MKIYPQDLGPSGYHAMLSVRAQGRHHPHLNLPLGPPSPEAGALTRFQRAWTRGAGVPEGAAKRARPAFVECRRAIWIGSPGLISTIFWLCIAGWLLELVLVDGILSQNLDFHLVFWTWGLIAASATFYSTFLRPRRVFWQMHEALTGQEIEQLQAQVRDPLTREYLSVVELLRLLTPLTDADSEKALRRALSALGEAIEELPFQNPRAAQGDPAQMRSEALRLTDEAHRETDGVIAASLERRAQSLARRAQTVGSIALLQRRNQTLREELGEQIETLRTSVAALGAGSRQNPHDLVDLAASIQHVAEEANAIAVAHTELETSMYAGLRSAMETENVSIQAWRKVHS